MGVIHIQVRDIRIIQTNMWNQNTFQEHVKTYETYKTDFNRTENEKHYGCYKVGILFSVIIILLLLLGCVPIFYLTHNNNLILLILLITLILIGIVTYVYFRWQHRRALQMRRSYEEQKMNLTRSVKRPATNGLKQAKPNAEVPKLEIDKGKSAGQDQPRYSFI